MTKQGHFHATCRKMAGTGVYHKKGKGNILRKMTEIQLKKLLRQLPCSANTGFSSEECSKISKSNPETLPYSGNVQLRIIGETLNILSRNERFVIETHLVYHHTWTETMTLFSEENGPGCGRSERTLKQTHPKPGIKENGQFY
ncbi:MAG: hypothetical protein ACLR0U_25750 [Enterocloster clostridioformis]